MVRHFEVYIKSVFWSLLISNNLFSRFIIFTFQMESNFELGDKYNVLVKENTIKRVRKNNLYFQGDIFLHSTER